MTSELDKLGRTIGGNMTATEDNAQRMSKPGTIHARFNFNKYKVNVRNTKTEIRSVPVGDWLVWDQGNWDEKDWADADYLVSDDLTGTTNKNASKTTATWDGSGTITF